MFRYLPSMPTFRTVFFFVINLCWILSEAFSSSIEMFIWFLFFNLLMWYIKLTGLQILKNLCIPGINTSWLWCMILWMYYWICFAVFCWGFLHLCSWVISACKFSFFIIIVHLQSSQGQSNDSHRATHNDGGIPVVPLMFSFLLWVICDSGENSPCCLCSPSGWGR